MKRLILLFLILTAGAWAQPSRYVLVNVYVHTGFAEPYLGFVEVNGSSIGSIGYGTPPAGPLIDLGGAHLYPGLIDADSSIGLVEFESLRATRDHQEVGTMNPNLVANMAFRAESDLVEVARSQGILFSAVNPRSDMVSGQGSLMRLWGWTWEDMTVVQSWAMAVGWPGVKVPLALKGKKRKDLVSKIGRSLFELDDAFVQAQVYSESPTEDVKWSSLKPFAQGNKPVLIRVDNKQEIRSALDWTKKRKLKPILLAGRDIHFFADELAERNIPVIYGSLFNENPKQSQSYDLHYRTPKLLMDKGVLVALSANGLAFDARELRDLAGRARAFGLSDVAALQTVTVNPAKILGVSDRLGSIVPGNEASFVLCQGDILEVAPVVTRAWGAGRELDLTDRQKTLYRKYQERLRFKASSKD